MDSAEILGIQRGECFSKEGEKEGRKEGRKESQRNSWVVTSVFPGKMGEDHL